jgi:O-antigen/teichoic acid export membrane protein
MIPSAHGGLQSRSILRLGQISQLVGAILYAAIMWTMALYLIRFSNLQSYGQYAAALAVAAPIYMMTNARARLLISSNHAEGPSIFAYVAFRVLSSAIGILLLLVFSWWWQGNGLWIVFSVALFKAAEAISDILFGGYQRIGKPHLVGFGVIARGIVFAFCLLLAFILNIASVEGVVLLLFSALCLLTIMDAWFLLKQLDQSVHEVSRRQVVHVFHHLRPYMLIAFMASLFTVLPRLFLEQLQDYEALGLYSALMLFSNAALLGVGSLSQPYIRYFGQLSSTGRGKELLRLLTRLMAIPLFVTLAFAVVFLLARHKLAEILLAGKASVPDTYWFLLLGVILLNGISLIQWYVLAALDVRRVQVLLSASSLFVGILLCAVLIPNFGIAGAFLADTGGLVLQSCIGLCIIVYWARRPQPANKN